MVGVVGFGLPWNAAIRNKDMLNSTCRFVMKTIGHESLATAR